MVRARCEHDALPASEKQALVPIREERSVDLDLLEDAGRAIEAALRRQGYTRPNGQNDQQRRLHHGPISGRYFSPVLVARDAGTTRGARGAP